jgi:hypothetical protein
MLVGGNAFHYSRRDGPLGVAKKKDARIQIVRAIVHAKPSTAKGKEREDADAAAPQHKIVGILIPPGKEHSALSAVSRARNNVDRVLSTCRRHPQSATARNSTALGES